MKKTAYILLVIYLGISSLTGTLLIGFLFLEWWHTPDFHDLETLRPLSEVDLSPDFEPYTMFGPAKIKTVTDVFMPAQKGDVSSPEITLNSNGFRASEITKQKPDKISRIFLTGGSVVFQGHTNESTISAFLQKRIQEKNPLKKFEVINAGVSEFISDQEFLLIATKLIDFEPDIIIVFDGFNDFMIPKSTEPRIGYPDKFKALELAWYDNKKILGRLLNLPLLEHIKAGSHFLRLYNPNWSYVQFLQDTEKSKDAQSQTMSSPQDAANHLIMNWRKIARFLSANQVKGIFILQPYNQSQKVYEEEYFLTESKINSLSREFQSPQNTIQFLSYRNIMQKKSDWFYDIVHTYDAGNEYYAEMMAKDMERVMPK